MNNSIKILTGIDIVNNNRIKRLITRSEESLKDIFSKTEIEYCMKKKFIEQSFGVRFAAKEALLKAIGAGIFDFELNSIEVRNLENGKPVLFINNKKIIDRIKKMLNKDEFHIDISVSHEKEYSIAHVIIC